MDERLSRLESEVERLAATLDRVEKRLSSLESGSSPVVTRTETRHAGEPGHVAVSDSEIARGVTLVGRTLLILGGGYLLRALTEAEALAPLVGAGLGLLYALLWLVLADLAGARANSMSAAFFGGAAVLVAFPLLWETTARFDLLPTSVGAASLALVSGVAIAVAWRHRLRSFAWVTVVGATITSVALVFGTRELAPFTLLLVLLGVATLWLAYHAGWPVVHWLVAGFADLAVMGLAAGVAIQGSNVSPPVATAVALSLFGAYCASFVVRLLGQSAEPRSFEILQGGAATFLGYGGALFAAPGAAPAYALGALGIGLGTGAYAVALSPRIPRAETATYFEGMGWLLLVLGGFGLLSEPTPLFVFAGLALVWMGSSFGREVLRLHGAFLVLVAAFTSGLLVHVAYALAARASVGWPPVTGWMLLTSAGAAAAYALYPAEEDDRWFMKWRMGRLLLLTLLVLAIGGLALAAIGPRVASDAAVLATVRTAVLALAALGLGWMARSPRFREAGWLVYPVLLLAGIKIVVEDFPHGRAATLFIALALYGGALILAPRISRQASEP